MNTIRTVARRGRTTLARIRLGVTRRWLHSRWFGEWHRHRLERARPELALDSDVLAAAAGELRAPRGSGAHEPLKQASNLAPSEAHLLTRLRS